jgi:glucosamine 6-phosphate synthetase-like amidotransferase/phosphosugar isomerase protein
MCGIIGIIANRPVAHELIEGLRLWYRNPKMRAFSCTDTVCDTVQLLAYRTAVLKGTDVDQPRNLAKSVTVE